MPRPAWRTWFPRPFSTDRNQRPIPLAPRHRRIWRGLHAYCSCGRRRRDCPDRHAEVPTGRVRAHLPLRPLWLCRVCAAPWPCATARLSLVAEYDHDRIALNVYLCAVLHEAVADLYRLHPDDGPEPAALFARFLGWVPKGSSLVRGGSSGAGRVPPPTGPR